MDGVKDFEKFQIGSEIKNAGAPGTAVVATWLNRGTWIPTHDSARVHPDENLGRMMPGTRVIQPSIKDGLTQGPDPLTFEELPYLLNAAIRSLKSGIKDGAGSGYIRRYDWPIGPNTIEIKAATISFASATKKIADSGTGLAFVKTGGLIKVSGSTSNDGYYTVATGGVAAEIVTTEALVTEAAGAIVCVEVIPQTYTGEGGNNSRVEQSTFLFPLSFEINGKGGEDQDYYTISSEWAARQWATKAAGFTAGVNPVAVHEALFGNTHIYIDAIGGTIGTTEKTDILSAVGIKVNTGLSRKYSGGGNLYYASRSRKMPELTVTLPLWMNAAGLAEYDAWQSNTPRLIRIRVDGYTLASAGTLYTKAALIIDLPGTWESFPKWDAIAGSNILPGTFRVAYEDTAALGPSITVVNEVSSMA